MGGLSPVLRAVVLAAAAAASAGLGCQRRAEAVQGEAALRRLVRQRTAAVERATGLTFKREPAIALRARAEMREYVLRKLDEQYAPAELRGVEAAYRLFGLAPDSLDLRETMVALLTEQVAGYYDPDSVTLYVGADLAGMDSLVIRTTVSHELVHALQHQYLNLDSIVDVKRQSDRTLAAQSVLEGQATLAQTLVMMPEQRLENLQSFWEQRGVVRKQQTLMPQFARAPLWLRETLIFPYLGGADFVRWFAARHPRRQPFGAAMPVSSEQILHPERYAAGDAPTALAFATGERGVAYEDGLGELEVRVLFMELLGDTGEVEAPRLAAGWDGDRYRAYEAGNGAYALVWYSVWDDAGEADEFAEGLERAWGRRPARPGRRTEIVRRDIEGVPGVRLVDAPAGWPGWRSIPAVRRVP
jgi:hypothetical protein